MSVSTTNNRISYTGNGSTTAFSYPYKFLANGDLVVIKREIATGTETVQTLTTHYTVTGAGEDAGGTVTMLSAPSASYQLVIYGDPALTQEVDLVENDNSPAEVQEQALDRLTLIAQRLKNRMDRAVRLSDGFAPTFDPVLPGDLDDAAGKVPLINDDGDGFADAADWPTADDIENAEENATAAAASAAAALASQTAAASSASAAAASATAAQTAVDSVIWRDVVFKTFADSPYTVTDADRGKLFVINTSGGAFTINLPQISGLNLTDPWAIGIKKNGADANAITVARGGTDTINGGTSATIDTNGGGLVVIPDTDTSPDEWTTQAFGAVDDGAITTAKLNSQVFSGLTGVAAENDDYIAIADTSDSNNKKKALVSSVKNRKVTTLTATGTLSVAYDSYTFSGASFTATIPTPAAGQEGKRFTLKHGGTSLTQVYTLTCAGSETIGGVASGSYALYTNNEVLEIEWNGTNWDIINHRASTPWASAGTTRISATTTAPIKGASATTDVLWWRRQGDSVHVRSYYQQLSASGGSSGSGDYLFGVPQNMSIDTAKCTVYASAEGWASTYTQAYSVGDASFGNGTNAAVANVVPYDATYVRIFGMDVSNTGTPGSAGYNINGAAAMFYHLNFIVPISGWQP